jgi:cytochrome b561
MTDNAPTRYDSTTIILHWATAVSVLALWIIGQTADLFPHNVAGGLVWPIHVVWGFVLVVLVGWRVVWRIAGGVGLPAADQGLLHIAAKATHSLLYLLIAAVLLLGVVNAFVRGYNLFGLFSLPQIGDKDWRRPITHWHELAANALLVLALLHAAAALAHHYLFKDGVLRRMLPAPERIQREA